MTSKYTTDLRLIAIVTMLIDHIGFIFFPQIVIFRIIGRFSFPLFVWGVAQGAKYTHDIKKYAWRLFLIAVVSQYPFYLFSQIAPVGIARLNVLFTLLFGLFAIQTYKSKLSLIFKISIYYLLFYFSYYFDMDYQATGVFSVLFSYIFMTNLPALFISQLILFSVNIFSNFISIFAPFAFLLTLFNSPKPNPKFKYLFYFIYPLQFLLLYIIRVNAR